MGRQALAGIIVTAALAFGPAVCRGEDWPQLQHDPQRTGHTQDPGPTGGKVLWEFDLNRELVGKCAQPVIVGGKVYLGSLRGVLRCFDAATGTVAWEYRTKGPIAHSAGVAERLLLTSSWRLSLVRTRKAGRPLTRMPPRPDNDIDIIPVLPA